MVWILSWCDAHGLDPIDFYEQKWLKRSKGYQLLAAFQAWRSKKEEEEMEKAKHKK